MKNHLKKIIIILVFFIITPAFAWDSTGHRLVAQIAYDNLTNQAKNKVDQLTELLDQHYPPPSRFLFASLWADQIKNDDVVAFNDWHFINYPISFDHTPSRQPEKQNVVWAIWQSENVLQSSKANDYEKAVFLRFLLHFAGDVHQPLHCAELYSQQFPQGDSSGNLFLIQTANAQDLHSYWDQGLGFFRNNGQHYPLTNKEVQRLAQRIETQYPANYFGDRITDTNPQDWAQESFAIAKNFAYQIKENSVPSNTYNTQGQILVQQQIALAGYRLANLLNHIF